MSETWAIENIYCVNCGGILQHCKNNKPVSDLICYDCREEYELKSTNEKIKNKIIDGSYATMITKIESGKIPTFLYLNYSKIQFNVENLIIIPKQFFTSEIVIKRKPLSNTAKRANWVGCEIDFSKIPKTGIIYMIKNGDIVPKEKILNDFNRISFLRKLKFEPRGWLLDIMKCIDNINKIEFNLNDIYDYEKILGKKYPSNHNIKAKIRQQLQILRDYGYLEFTDKGKFKLL